MKEIKNFKSESGKQPIKSWFDSLDKVTKSRISTRLDNLQEGYYGDFKVIDKDLKELRFKFGSGYRIYFHEENDIIILLLCGGDKSTQNKDIKKAKEYLKLWREQND